MRRSRRAGRPRPEPVAVLFVLIFVFYGWTALSSGTGLDFTQDRGDYYNLQTDGYLQGQLHLPVEPRKELLALENPYDPVANAPYRAHDLSLYKGRYYMYWGPTPVLTLFGPWRILPLGDMPESLAVALFAFVGLVFSFLLLRLLVRRYVPDTPRWMEVAGLVALAVGNAAPFVLRRPAVYEVAIAAGFCFVFAGLWLLATGLLRERWSLRRLALGSLMLGFAVGARPSLGLAGVVLALALAWLVRRDEMEGMARVRAGAALLVPFAVCVSLLMIYNQARFGSPTEFGPSYQLAGVAIDSATHFDLDYGPRALWSYVIAPARLSLDFPFFHLPPPPRYPGPLPEGYSGDEPTGGILPNSPILLALPITAVLLVRRRLSIARELLGILAVLTGTGLALLLVLSFTLWGSTERYLMDFASLLLVPALIGWYAIARGLPTGSRVRRAVTGGGAVLIAWGTLVSVAVSFTGYYDLLRANHPGTYRAIERFFSPLPTLATMVAGRAVVTDVLGPASGIEQTDVDYTTAGTGPVSFWVGTETVTVEVVSPGDRVVALTGTVGAGPDAPPGRALELEASSESMTSRSAVAGRREVLPVRLHRGLNEVEVRVLGADPASPGRQVRVDGLILR